MGCRQEDRGNLILVSNLNPDYQDGRGVWHVWPCHAGSLMELVGIFILASDISVFLCPTMGSVPAASVSTKCELVLSSVLVAGAESPSKMTTPRRSPNFPAFLGFLLLEGAGRCCWHPVASALLMCGALAWSWPDLQVHRGTGVQWDPVATVKGVESPQTQAAAQHFGKVA